jgi:hypothetical protein
MGNYRGRSSRAASAAEIVRCGTDSWNATYEEPRRHCGDGRFCSHNTQDNTTGVLSRVIVDNEQRGTNPLTRPRRLTG